MGISDEIWDGLSAVIKMNDKIESLAMHSVAMNGKIENLTERVIRLETALELGLATARARMPAARQKRG
jgi:hypothetical protein